MLKQLIVVTFSWKITIIYSKVLYLILNVQVSIQNFYFKLLNMCKFANDRKTLILIIHYMLNLFSHFHRLHFWRNWLKYFVQGIGMIGRIFETKGFWKTKEL